MSKGGKTRQRIVAKAATLFNQRGFDGGSMADLMKATGLEKGGIYRHFSTKEELAAEAFDYAWQAATGVGMHALDSIPNSVDKLKRFISNFIDRRPSVPGGCPLLNTAIDADNGNPILRERARKALHQWQDLLSEMVKSGIKRKEIRKGVHPKKLVTLIVGSLEGALMISRLERDREALLETRLHLERYLDTEVRLRPRRRD
jgi:TetR/AcrR family transcriptional regulator, transcriptional repressor for nem operon